MDGASIGAKEGPSHMRQQYTPIFARILASRLWALSPATRCVWLWLELRCDPEGYMSTDVAGVAIGAHVTGGEAREALEVLSLEDADADPEDPNKGRLIERVPGGWRVLGFEEQRDLAKREARNARTRRYMANSRAKDKAANDVIPVTPCEPIDTPPKTKPTPTTKPFPQEGESPPTPTGRSVSLDKLPESWQPSAALRAEAVMAGVADLDARILSLRTGPIGGQRGVLPDQLDNYIRSFFGTWRTWRETDQAKAAAAAKPRTGGRSYSPGDDIATTDAATAFRATDEHRAFCRAHKLDVEHAVREYRKGTRPGKLGTLPAQEEFTHRLKCWATTGTFLADGPMPKAPRKPKEAA
jgi:hypothetical protein